MSAAGVAPPPTTLSLEAVLGDRFMRDRAWEKTLPAPWLRRAVMAMVEVAVCRRGFKGVALDLSYENWESELLKFEGFLVGLGLKLTGWNRLSFVCFI